MKHTRRDLRALLWRDFFWRQIFGANVHCYGLARVSPAQMEAFERALGVALPPAYRAHLLALGAGAGPHYGLMRPAAVLDEWAEWRDDYLRETGVAVSPARPFPLTQADADAVARARRGGGGPLWLPATWPCDGCIPIADQGCTYWSVLVTAGELAGTVWMLDIVEGFEATMLPAMRPPGVTEPGVRRAELAPLPSPPPFDIWYRGWVDQALADFGMRPSAAAV